MKLLERKKRQVPAICLKLRLFSFYTTPLDSLMTSENENFRQDQKQRESFVIKFVPFSMKKATLL